MNPSPLPVPAADQAGPPGRAKHEALIGAIRSQTPARILVGRTGPSYLTPTQLALRQDHAAARDAVWAEVDLEHDLGTDLVQRYGLFEVATRASDKQEYLMRPDLGRL